MFHFSFLSNLPIFKNFQTSYTWFFPVFCLSDSVPTPSICVSLEERTYGNTRHKNTQGGGFKVKSIHSSCLSPCYWKMSNWTQALSRAAMTSKPPHHRLHAARRCKTRAPTTRPISGTCHWCCMTELTPLWSTHFRNSIFQFSQLATFLDNWNLMVILCPLYHLWKSLRSRKERSEVAFGMEMQCLHDIQLSFECLLKVLEG